MYSYLYQDGNCNILLLVHPSNIKHTGVDGHNIFVEFYMKGSCWGQALDNYGMWNHRLHNAEKDSSLSKTGKLKNSIWKNREYVGNAPTIMVQAMINP